MNDELRVKTIKKILEDENEVSAEELIIQIEELFPEKTKIVAPPPQSSEERLEYMRNWRLEKKRYDKVKSEEEKRELKIKKALSRPKQLCFDCKEPVEVTNPTYKIVRKRNRTNDSIIVSFKCPNCSKNCKYFGGNL